jgi:hypothetical protein
MCGILGGLFNNAIVIEENGALDDGESMSYEFERVSREVFLA